MKVNFMKVIVFFILIALTFSCTKNYQFKRTTDLQFQNTPIKIKYNVVKGNRISGSATTTQFLIFKMPFSYSAADNVYYATNERGISILNSILDMFKNNGLMGKAKAMAAYNACRTSGYDIIIAPRYDCKVSDFWIFKTVTATVTGYGAFLEDIKIDQQFEDYLKKLPVNKQEPVRYYNNYYNQYPPQQSPYQYNNNFRYPPVDSNGQYNNNYYNNNVQNNKQQQVTPQYQIDSNSTFYVNVKGTKYGPLSVKQIKDLLTMAYITENSEAYEVNTNRKYKIYEILR